MAKQKLPPKQPKVDVSLETDIVSGYICAKCGKIYDQRVGNFPRTNCPLYAGNDRFMTTCNDCIVELFNEKVKELGTELDAVKEVCRIYFLYWNPSAFAMTKGGSATVPRIKAYFQKVGMSQFNRGCCWDDYLVQSGQVQEIQQHEDQLRQDEYTVPEAPKESTAVQILRWGKAFTPEEHQSLDAHYDLLSSQAENPKDQEPIIKTLCETYILKYRAMEQGNIDSFKKLSELYSTYYKQLEKKEEKDNTKDFDKIPFGVMVAIAEDHAPAEYYKDVELFKDYAGISDYVSRHVLRPLKNLLTGDHEKDPVYVIEEETN